MNSNNIYIKILIIVGLIIGINKSINSFIQVYSFKNTINTNEEWRFYFSIVELISFSLLTILLLILILKKNSKNQIL